MNIKKHILLSFLIISFLFVFTSTAYAVPSWLRNLRISITPQIPDSYNGTGAEFLANPIYIQGEQTTFDITFTYEVRRWWFRIRMPVYIPPECIRATFPNSDTVVTLNHLFWGYYTYTSPALTIVGERNHTLTVTIAYTIRFRILGRTYTIPIVLTQARSSISVNQRPLDIQITSPPNGTILNTNLLSVSGTIDDNTATVTVNEIPAEVSDNSFSVEIPVEEGENTITAHAENEFGTTDTDTVTVTIDTVPPQNPDININEGTYTNTATINLTLSAEGADEMIISEDPGFLGAVWEAYVESKTFTLSEGDASKTVYVKFRDVVQNETLPVSGSIILDTTLPQVQINFPLDESITNQTQTNVSGTFTEVNLDTIAINGVSAVIEGGAFTAEGIPLNEEGNNVIRAEIVDLAQNHSSNEINLIKDTISPEIQITNPVDGSFSNQHVTDVSGTFVEANPDTVIVNGIEALVDGNNFSVEDVPLNSEGSNTIIAEISDLVGHTNSQEINVTRDTVLPVIEITYPEGGLSTGESEITISGTYTEVNMERITVNGIEATFGEGLFSASGVPLPIIGNNTITVIATDRARNTSEASIVIERVLTTEGILESLYNHFNLINDMTADMVVTSTFDSQPFGPPVYARYYYKKINKTKTEFYDTAERENITEIVITDNEMEYFISPVTRYISQDNLADRAGISQGQFRNMDITSNVEGFIENHTLTQIETEANPEEGIYVIESVPNTPNQLYSKLKLWIDVNKGLLVKSELYRGETLVQTTDILGSEEIAPGIWTETRLRNIPELEAGEYIYIVDYSNIQINQGLVDSLFDPENQL